MKLTLQTLLNNQEKAYTFLQRITDQISERREEIRTLLVEKYHLWFPDHKVEIAFHDENFYDADDGFIPQLASEGAINWIGYVNHSGDYWSEPIEEINSKDFEKRTKKHYKKYL